MSKTKLEAITNHLMMSAERLRYGTVSAVLRIHEGRVVSIQMETTEITKERKEVKE